MGEKVVAGEEGYDPVWDDGAGSDEQHAQLYEHLLGLSPLKGKVELDAGRSGADGLCEDVFGWDHVAEAEGFEATGWQVGEEIVSVIGHWRHGAAGQDDGSSFLDDVSEMFTGVEQCILDSWLALFVSGKEEAAFCRRVHQDCKEALEELQCATIGWVWCLWFGRFFGELDIVFNFVSQLALSKIANQFVRLDLVHSFSCEQLCRSDDGFNFPPVACDGAKAIGNGIEDSD